MLTLWRRHLKSCPHRGKGSASTRAKRERMYVHADVHAPDRVFP